MTARAALFPAWLLAIGFHLSAVTAEDWPQLKFDSHHSGNVPSRSVATPLGLVAAVPTGDAIFTSPVVAGDGVYVVDGSGSARCFDRQSLREVWRYDAPGGIFNCNLVSSPAVVGEYLHFGTSAGGYCILDRKTGQLARSIDCRGPVFSAPVTDGRRAYFSTLGAEVYAVEPDGQIAWTWDFVREVIGFRGDRWSGQDWLEFKKSRVTWRDHFCCARDVALAGDTVVIPAGGRVVFLRDAGDRPELRSVAEIPSFAGKEYPAAFGLSIGGEGEVYVQWHRRDNAGRVEILRLAEDGSVTTDFVPGTQTAIELPGLLGLTSVSVRGTDVYRVRPEEGLGFCRHERAGQGAMPLADVPSIAAPILTREHGIVGGLDGQLHVVPLASEGDTWSFRTAFHAAITSPPAVCDGRVYFGCEDGYLYVLGPEGSAPLPTRPLGLDVIRTPLQGEFADPVHDWSTNYGDMQNTNVATDSVRPPLTPRWIRRYEGTFKHLPVCGGGRMYTHTAEGQVLAVEQETGRQLWRRYWPGVYLSFTSPLYFRRGDRECLLVPQAGLQRSMMRCLDAATGERIWEAPFTGSPSWSRQGPPVLQGNLAIYASGSGRYAAQGSDRAFVMKGDPESAADGGEVMSWIYTHDNPYYPQDNVPRLWAWDLDTGRVVWEQDFSRYGRGGNDCGLCLLDGRLFYSTFFGYSPDQRRRRGLPPGPNGITAELDPASGEVRWLTTEHHVTAGCTVSARDGRIYLGGYNRADERTQDRYVFCLDADDGSLVWRSAPLRSAVNVISIGEDYLFTNASGGDGHVLDPATGAIVSRFNMGYACTRFTCAGQFVLGANMDLIDLADGNRLVSTGPCIDSRECVGGVVSNGRLYYTSQASGLQICLTGAGGGP